MKRAVIFVLMLVLVMHFITSDSYCQGGDSSIHGVVLHGDCFNCGESDEVCPEDYGADCSLNPDPDCGAQNPQAFWSLDNQTSIDKLTVLLPDGRDVYMVAKNLDLPDNTEILFEIYEDKLGDKKITNTTANVSGGKVIGIWKITENDINEITNIENLIYFKATADGLDIKSNPELNITTTYSSGIVACGDYDNQNDCDSNPWLIGYSTGVWETYDTACKRRINKTGCSWTGSECAQNTSIEYDTSALDCHDTDSHSASCIYTEGERIGDCNAGDEYFQINYISTQPGCANFTSGITPCPANIQLGFFGLFNLIIGLIIISFVYFLLSKKESL